jgi:hypothetical protein
MAQLSYCSKRLSGPKILPHLLGVLRVVVIGLNVTWVGLTVTEDLIATIPAAATLLDVALQSLIVLLAEKLLQCVEKTEMDDEVGATVDPLPVVHQEEEAAGTGALVQRAVIEEETEIVMIGTTEMTEMTYETFETMVTTSVIALSYSILTI